MARPLARLVVRCALAAGLLMVVPSTADRAPGFGPTSVESIEAPDATGAALVHGGFGDHRERGLTAKWRWFTGLVVLAAAIVARPASRRQTAVVRARPMSALLGDGRAGRAPPSLPLLVG